MHKMTTSNTTATMSSCDTRHSDVTAATTTTTTTTATPAARKAHFQIDWRNLTYYHKEPRSLLGKLGLSCRGDKIAGQNQQLDYLFEEDEQEEEEQEQEVDDNESHNGQCTRSYCGLQRDLMTRTIGRSGQQRPRAILNSLDGCFRSGELAAILGPSGAGKSTFLSALFGNKQESSHGQTRVTWFTPQAAAADSPPLVPQQNQRQQRALRIAFLPQHDHLLNHLTVYETLMFASKIKNPHQASDKLFHRQNVKRVAKMLKLTECFNTRCGRLSGGQYKRVSIGQELLSEPDVIILDEPTSGLDAMTCLATVRTLKSIVLKHPICIILTIHQPDVDVFNLFDQVYVIAQGGMAIYEGPPQDVVASMAQANLFMPSDSYNPARFIVENAFVADLETTSTGGAGGAHNLESATPCSGGGGGGVTGQTNAFKGNVGGAKAADQKRVFHSGCAASISEEDEIEMSTEDEDDEHDERQKEPPAGSFLRRSLSSLTDALAGKTVLADGPNCNQDKTFRDSGRRPLLNIGIQMADGKLITSEQLASARQAKAANLENQMRKQQMERLQLLRRLNRMQKERYYGRVTLTSGSCRSSDILSQRTGGGGGGNSAHDHGDQLQSDTSSTTDSLPSWSEARETIEQQNEDTATGGDGSSVASCAYATEDKLPAEVGHRGDHFILQLGGGGGGGGGSSGGGDLSSLAATPTLKQHQSTENEIFMPFDRMLSQGAGRKKLRRQFDKRLSARYIQSKQSDYPIWYHSFLLTHRTWLSIVRDPIFFGIQFTMHTTIPILLALIFGSAQEEGCPQVGNFDLVQFAYADQANFIASTMHSIRQSIGNIGIIFFEMFVLSFAINCITALVFPLDMYVLLKEYRNGWYSLRSYFFGRTLADLPVPIVLHSMAMSILCYLTGQPLTWWRFLAIIGIVILASLVAQSVGLTIGALLMKSSQSAVLAAAGIVAPFFALSGFIVRIHTLPWVARWAAQGSYLYHLLNGFIIMRYGFGRCACDDVDFEQDPAHQIPSNLKTMASIWIGTYSDEFEHSNRMIQASGGAHLNRTNVDPNIDIIDKLMGAFKMANSFGHKVDSCDDVLPYSMLDFNLKDSDIWHCCLALVVMLLVSRALTFGAIYYKIRSFS